MWFNCVKKKKICVLICVKSGIWQWFMDLNIYIYMYIYGGYNDSNTVRCMAWVEWVYEDRSMWLGYWTNFGCGF